MTLTQAPWQLHIRIAFRLAAAYLILEGHMFPLGYLPFGWVRTFSEWHLDARVAAANWTQVHVFGLPAPLPFAFTGSADSMARLAMHFNVIALAILAAGVWTLVDRRRTEYSARHAWLHAWVRLGLATIMFGYGFAKLIPTQFPTPALERYVQPLGEFSPMGLLWTLMGHSPAYNMFTGGIEVLGAVLVLFRRTSTLGALLLLAALSQVLMLNFTYDVPVKTFSVHLIVMAAFVAAPDVRRVAAVLVMNRAVPPRDLPVLLHDQTRRYALFALTAIFMGYIVWERVTGGIETRRATGPDAPRPVLYGIYDVESLQKNGVDSPPLLTDRPRWRRVVFAQNGIVTVRTMADDVTRYASKVDARTRSVALTNTDGRPPSVITLTYEVPEPDQLILRGQTGTDTIVARLRRVDDTKFLLLNRPFRWVQERPVNR